MIRTATALALACAVATPAGARDILLAMPVNCRLGADCFIQNYVDADAGPGAADFTCGPLSYDGHKGTDFALPSLAAMAAGVSVTAAAPGRVRATRDGEADNASPAERRECGNGVVIDHGGGWQSQYCHMKEGSIAVRPGQQVAMGTELGQIGLSGRTEFAHLHFELRHEGGVRDPFNRDGITTCIASPDDQLWLSEIIYRPGGLISTGMATSMPDFATIKAGRAAESEAHGNAAALFVWAHVFGAREGDVLRLSITRETGAGFSGPAIVEYDIPISRNQARLFRTLGKRRPDGGWPAGIYRGESRLIRGGRIMETSTALIAVQAGN